LLDLLPQLGANVSRALTPEEKVRYPWASRITDYVPVGFWRRLGLGLTGGGVSVLVLGVLVIYLFTSHLHLHHGVPRGADEWAVFGVSSVLLAAGFVIGLVTGISAWLRQGRQALMWSLGAALPPLLWFIGWLQMR
jgi:hypothetical protein